MFPFHCRKWFLLAAALFCAALCAYAASRPDPIRLLQRMNQRVEQRNAELEHEPSHGSADRIAALYCRYRINRQFELSPSFQHIDYPVGDSATDAVKIFGLRAQLIY
jgi:hypothetical protein